MKMDRERNNTFVLETENDGEVDLLKGNNQIIKYGYFSDSFPSDYIHLRL